MSQLVDDSGMTQHAVARRLGLSRSSVSDRLRGRTRWTTAELPVVAQMLGVSMSDLLDQRGYVVVNGVVYEVDELGRRVELINTETTREEEPNPLHQFRSFGDGAGPTLLPHYREHVQDALDRVKGI